MDMLKLVEIFADMEGVMVNLDFDTMTGMDIVFRTRSKSHVYTVTLYTGGRVWGGSLFNLVSVLTFHIQGTSGGTVRLHIVHKPKMARNRICSQKNSKPLSWNRWTWAKSCSMQLGTTSLRIQSRCDIGIIFLLKWR